MKNKFSNKLGLLMGLLLTASALRCQAQPAPAEDSLQKLAPYAFLKMQYNAIENDSAALAPFFRKLQQLEKGQRHRLVIVHIGDSHLQADFFSGRMRTALQGRFGCAGRGLVFPYKVAGTNSPSDLRSSSNVAWEAKRNVFPNQPLPIGISGITIRTADSNFVVQVGVAPNDSIDYSFDKVNLFCERGTDCYDLRVSKATGAVSTPEYTTTSSTKYHTVSKGQTLSHIAGLYGCSVADLQRWNSIRGTTIYPGQKLAVNSVQRTVKPPPADAFRDYAVIPGEGNTAQPAEVNLGEPVSSIYLRGDCSDPSQKHCMIYGVVLENSKQRGMLYHMIGVNGAKFEHYNVSENFADQLASLRPDLVIVSLGTNESMDAGYNDSTFKNNASRFFSTLKQTAPGASVLVTAPPDNYLRRRYTNASAEKAKNILQGLAISNRFAFWDLYDLMGGTSSIKTWKNAGLANYDLIHFTKAGYELQGDLLYQSLMESYEAFKQGK